MKESNMFLRTKLHNNTCMTRLTSQGVIVAGQRVRWISLQMHLKFLDCFFVRSAQIEQMLVAVISILPRSALNIFTQQLYSVTSAHGKTTEQIKLWHYDAYIRLLCTRVCHRFVSQVSIDRDLSITVTQKLCRVLIFVPFGFVWDALINKFLSLSIPRHNDVTVDWEINSRR